MANDMSNPKFSLHDAASFMLAKVDHNKVAELAHKMVLWLNDQPCTNGESVLALASLIASAAHQSSNPDIVVYAVAMHCEKMMDEMQRMEAEEARQKGLN